VLLSGKGYCFSVYVRRRRGKKVEEHGPTVVDHSLSMKVTGLQDLPGTALFKGNSD